MSTQIDMRLQYLELERDLKKYIPELNHHAKENLVNPKDQFLKINIGEQTFRTIKDEDSELMWYSGIKALKEYCKGR